MTSQPYRECNWPSSAGKPRCPQFLYPMKPVTRMGYGQIAALGAKLPELLTAPNNRHEKGPGASA
jgi:hypothetical protein